MIQKSFSYECQISIKRHASITTFILYLPEEIKAWTLHSSSYVARPHTISSLSHYIKLLSYKNKCSDRSMEVTCRLFMTLWQYDHPTNRPINGPYSKQTDMRGHREVGPSISFDKKQTYYLFPGISIYVFILCIVNI